MGVLGAVAVASERAAAGTVKVAAAAAASDWGEAGCRRFSQISQDAWRRIG